MHVLDVDRVLTKAFGSELNLTDRARHRLREYQHISISDHALERQRKRGISDLQIAVMLLFGEFKPSKDDTHSVAFDKPSRESAQRTLGKPYLSIVDRMNFYMVLANDSATLVTIAQRLRKRRN